MIRKRNGSVVESKEWKQCTFERDGVGNIIWRLPKDVRGNELDCLLIQEICSGVSFRNRISNLSLNCRVIVIEQHNSKFNKSHSLKGAYCISYFNDGLEILNKLYNNK